MASVPAVVWFRNDLRLHDHPALHAAAQTQSPLICVYVLDDDSDGIRALGGASRWWLAQSLQALGDALKHKKQALVLRRGAAACIIPDLVKDSGANGIYWNRPADPFGLAVDEQVAKALPKSVDVHTFAANLLLEPEAMRTNSGGAYHVYTPFWRRVAASDIRKTLPIPHQLAPAPQLESDTVADWSLEPMAPDWAGGIRAAWTPGEAAARRHLKTFLDSKLPDYARKRDQPSQDVTSMLSPHLHFGEISPADVWHATRFHADKEPRSRAAADKFLSELTWREFAHHLLHTHPDMLTNNLQKRFNKFPWRQNQPALWAWQRGQTGYPIVDAGMRQLWHTGWMHNRVRLITGSFLVKHLLIDWRDGERWFWDTLVDADIANNPVNWQWVAGSGADAAPYFRIFNPILQGEKFDPDGDYVRQWVPELARVPARVIHKPWEADLADLATAKVKLGTDYPAPIVDHAEARKRALAAFDRIKNG